LAGAGEHAGVSALVAALNACYAGTPALHERDCERAGFEWIDYNDRDQSVLAFIRRGRDPEAALVCISNFTPVVRHDYRVGVPPAKGYRELLNTDATAYGGSGVANTKKLDVTECATHGRAQSVVLTLPPLATVILQSF
jgi:1,4-alpha-glucan branching enzyme